MNYFFNTSWSSSNQTIFRKNLLFSPQQMTLQLW